MSEWEDSEPMEKPGDEFGVKGSTSEHKGPFDAAIGFLDEAQQECGILDETEGQDQCLNAIAVLEAAGASRPPLTLEQADQIEAEMRRLEADPAVSKHELRLFMQFPMPCGHAAGNLMTCSEPPNGCVICGEPCALPEALTGVKK